MAECPGCPGEALDLSQPDVRQPEIVLGSCEHCGGLYFVAEDPVDSGTWRAVGRARSERLLVV